MPKLRDKALKLFQRARVDLVDGKAGLRLYRVFRRTITPSDGRGGIGATWTVVDTELTEKPNARPASNRDVVESGGVVKLGMWILEKITPQDVAATVGTPASFFDLAPASEGQQVLIVLSGEQMKPYVAGPPPSGGGEFTVTSIDAATKKFSLRVWLAPAAGRVEP